MATPPTVLANTSTSSATAQVTSPSVVKFPLAPVLLAVGAGALIAGLGTGGVVFYLARTGRVPMERATAQRAEAEAPFSAHVMVLEPLLVNLADSGGSSYLRVALTLRIADPVDKQGTKGEKNKEDRGSDDAVAAVRDTVLSVLGRQTADGLLASDGKEHLKKELKAALAEHDSDLKLLDVYFTDFLVQH